MNKYLHEEYMNIYVYIWRVKFIPVRFVASRGPLPTPFRMSSGSFQNSCETHVTKRSKTKQKPRPKPCQH